MAFASKPTLLSIDQFADIMQVSPLAINQLDITKLGVSRECDVWYQWNWQRDDVMNREILVNAIAQAENIVSEHLGYWPSPRYTSDERIPYPRPYVSKYWDVWYNERWKLNSVQTKYGKVWEIGTPAYQIISAVTPVVKSDRDGDGISDWFTTAPIATTVTDECEIGAYYIDADRPVGVPSDEECWRIRPVKVVISGGFVSVSGPLWQLTDPDGYVSPTPNALDPTLPATFVGNIKVQRRYTDTTDQGSCSLEHLACCGTQCSNLVVDACFGERNAERGVIIPEATTNNWPLGQPSCCSGNCYYGPDFVTVNYLSGYPQSLLDGVCRMDNMMAQIVARLAVTLIPGRYCGDCMEKEIDYWRELLSEVELNSLSFEEANNPFGLMRGALWAWKRINERNHNMKAGAIL